jgi:cytochrome c
MEVCTPCHVVAPDQLSPRRFAVGPDFSAIANTPGMAEMALHAFLTTSHPTMPNLVLSPEVERNVIASPLRLKGRNRKQVVTWGFGRL